MPTIVSPSPRELVAQLSDEERVAVDILLGQASDQYKHDITDPKLCALVPDERRRQRLSGIARQLFSLGITVEESKDLDNAVAQWTLVAERNRREREEQMRLRAEAEAREQARLAAMPPVVRRAVLRNRRRRRNQQP